MKVFTKRDNRIFVIYVSAGCGRGMAEVSIWERVRPSWFIFKDKYIDSRCFWLADYNYDIARGINATLSGALHEESVDTKIQKSWENFKKSLDK
jgi:hypothetical protein